MIPLLVFLYILCMPLHLPPDPNCARVAAPYVKAAMKYHGIRFAEQLPTGELIFWRDGKRCRLLTKAFIKHYNRRFGIL